MVGLALGVVAALGAACANASTGVPDEPFPPAVVAAMGELAQEIGVEPAAVEVVGYTTVEWPDSCLGLPRTGEDCSEAITPGWGVELRVRGVRYRVHTDQFGVEVRVR